MVSTKPTISATNRSSSRQKDIPSERCWFQDQATNGSFQASRQDTTSGAEQSPKRAHQRKRHLWRGQRTRGSALIGALIVNCLRYERATAAAASGGGGGGAKRGWCDGDGTAITTTRGEERIPISVAQLGKRAQLPHSCAPNPAERRRARGSSGGTRAACFRRRTERAEVLLVEKVRPRKGCAFRRRHPPPSRPPPRPARGAAHTARLRPASLPNVLGAFLCTEKGCSRRPRRHALQPGRARPPSSLNLSSPSFAQALSETGLGGNAGRRAGGFSAAANGLPNSNASRRRGSAARPRLSWGEGGDWKHWKEGEGRIGRPAHRPRSSAQRSSRALPADPHARPTTA
eukprot:354629-Chlamydomonas_euryale.AAC.7